MTKLWLIIVTQYNSCDACVRHVCATSARIAAKVGIPVVPELWELTKLSIPTIQIAGWLHSHRRTSHPDCRHNSLVLYSCQEEGKCGDHRLRDGGPRTLPGFPSGRELLASQTRCIMKNNLTTIVSILLERVTYAARRFV